MHTEGSAHGEALLRLHTGQANLVRPSVGAWVSYGLGSENESLPACLSALHTVRSDPGNANDAWSGRGTQTGDGELRYRTGAEGRISHLKRRYGMDRSRLKGDEGQQIWNGWAILAYNADTLAVRER